MHRANRDETGSQKAYRSYLLRLWCDGREATACWQASLDDPHTGERIGFGSLEDLFAFLVEQVEASSQSKMGNEP